MKELNICFTCVGTKVIPSRGLEYDSVNTPGDWWTQALNQPSFMPASDLYSGPGFDQVRRIISKLQRHYSVNVFIFSAGFGILKGSDIIPGYDATFSSSAKSNKVVKRDQRMWLRGVTKHQLPEGTVCVFPRSYEEPYQRAFSNIDDMILIQGTSEDRKDLGCSMIRCTTTLMEKIVDNQIKEDWDLDPVHWKQLRGYEV